MTFSVGIRKLSYPFAICSAPRSHSQLLSLILLTLTIICSSARMASAGKVSPTLVEMFKDQPKITVMIDMVEGTSAALESVNAQQFPDRDSRANAVTSALQALTERSQKSLKEFMQSHGISFQSMWINNSVVAENVTLEQCQQLAKVEGVKEVREQHVVHTMGTN